MLPIERLHGAFLEFHRLDTICTISCNNILSGILIRTTIPHSPLVDRDVIHAIPSTPSSSVIISFPYSYAKKPTALNGNVNAVDLQVGQGNDVMNRLDEANTDEEGGG